MTLHRLSIAHGRPAGRITINARATMTRTVHGLTEHGLIELVEEHSTPSSFSFTMRAPEDVREGLLIVADALPKGPGGWLAGWTVVEER